MPREIYLRSEYYNDFLVPGDMCCPICVVLAKEPDFRAVFTCGRSRKAGDFDDEHVSRLGRIGPHLTRAAKITSRLSRARIERNSSAEALNRIGQGVIIVTSGGQVLFANAAAQALLKAGDGLRCGQGSLRALLSAQSSQLLRLIASAAHQIPGSGGVMLLTRPIRRPLSILVTPLGSESRWTLNWQPAAIVFIADPEAEQPHAIQQLRALYRFTPMEAAVALEIARGVGLQVVTDRLSISLTTARTHLQHAF